MQFTADTRAGSPQRRSGDAKFSRLSVMALVGAFLVGVLLGAMGSLHRSSVTEKHVAGTNALTIHIVLAAAVVGVVLGTRRARARSKARGNAPVWMAPFSAGAMARLGWTIRFRSGFSLLNLLRVLAVMPLLLVMAYSALRMGEQVIGGLDPNATVNAWGGPTYIGALLAHWMDSLLGFSIAAYLLGRVMLRS